MNRPIRVLELRSVRGIGGGPDKTILAGATRNGHSPVAFTICYLHNAPDAAFPIGRQVEQLGLDYVEVRERHSLDPAIWPTLRALVRSRGIDIVHAHEYKTDLLAYLLAKAEGVIPLATAHGWTGHTVRERAVYYPADKRLLARFPKVVAVSGDIQRVLLAAGADARRVEVVLNGIDEHAFRPCPAKRVAARAHYGLLPEETVIGAVGRLEPQKRFDLLIDAFDRVRQTRPSARLLIAGEGSHRAKLERCIADRNLKDACRLVGQAGVITFHHALDAFVQSSDYEGTPNVVLEAMALETPIVATAVGGTAELLTDGVHGLLVPPGRVETLVAAIHRVLSDPDGARARASAARHRVETDLSFSRRMARLDTICCELVESKAHA